MKQMLVALLVGIGIVSRAAAASPNVIVFYADDMGIGDVGCYGCRDIQTPNIDRLAQSGVRLTNYYSAAPICSASRAALLTGRYPIRAGVPANVSSTPGDPGMPASEFTLAELATTRGYSTALIGKWHLGFSHDTQPNAQGFDYFFGHHAGCIDYYSHWFYWQGPDHHDLYRGRTEIHEEGQYILDLVVRESNKFIDDHRNRPFFMYVAFNAPHYPLQAPERFRRMYALLPDHRRQYAPLVGALDDAIGRIMAGLRERRLVDNTLVFFMSDNGPSTEDRANFGGGSVAPYRGYKFSLFEGGIHMPAIASWPGHLPEGQTRDQLAIAMDIFPTVATAIGAKLPTDRVIDGRNWWPFMRDASAPGHDILFWSHDRQNAVRKGKWKLVQRGLEYGPPKLATRPAGTPATGPIPRSRPAPTDQVFLSDLQADPGEKRNVASRHPDLVQWMLDAHAAWRQSLRDTSSAK